MVPLSSTQRRDSVEDADGAAAFDVEEDDYEEMDSMQNPQQEYFTAPAPGPNLHCVESDSESDSVGGGPRAPLGRSGLAN